MEAGLGGAPAGAPAGDALRRERVSPSKRTEIQALREGVAEGLTSSLTLYLDSAGVRAAAAARLRLDARAVIVGVDVTTDDPADAIPKAFGMTSAGAAVVRPDGYIGWRSPAELADPADTLTAVLASLAHA